MDVLHIVWSGDIGGAERAIYQLVRAQQRLSTYKPAVAFAQRSGYYAGLIKGLGCEVLDLGLEKDRQLHEAARVARSIRRFKVHHFHSPDITPMLASMLCPRTTRILTHRGGLTDYTGIQKWRYRLAGVLLRSSFHGFSGNTRHACISAGKLYKMDPGAWRVTYNGIDFDLLEPTRSKEEVAAELGYVPNGTVTVGASAQLREWKRIDRLLLACSGLQNCRLVIIGDGPARSDLEATAKKLGMADRTIFAGRKENVSDYLNLIDVFALPSMGLESFGNSVVEAMAMGIPSIVFSDGGGLLEHVKDGETGFVVSSVEEMALRLAQLIENRDLRREIGLKGRDFVRSRYTLGQMVQSYDELYDFAIAKREMNRKS